MKAVSVISVRRTPSATERWCYCGYSPCSMMMASIISASITPSAVTPPSPSEAKQWLYAMAKMCRGEVGGRGEGGGAGWEGGGGLRVDRDQTPNSGLRHTSFAGKRCSECGPGSGFRSGAHTTTSAQTSSGTPLIPNSTVVGFAIKVVSGIST